MREMTVYRWGGGGRAASRNPLPPPHSAAKAQNKPRRENDGIGLSPRGLCSPSAQTPQPPTVCVHPLPPAPSCGCLRLKGSSPLVPPLHARAQTHAGTHAGTHARPVRCPRSAATPKRSAALRPTRINSRAASSTHASERADENPGIRASQVAGRKLHWRIRCCGNLSAQI